MQSLSTDWLITALGLPASSRVDQRVPKKLLAENGAPTTADKRQINDGIEETLWLAALKPTTVGIPEYRDSIREYLEIAVLHLVLRGSAKVTRLVELIHRAVPYPVLLLTEQGASFSISAAQKRWAQNEAGKTVLDGEVVDVVWSKDGDAAYLTEFGSALALVRQPQVTLAAVYQGWIDTLHALEAARATGVWKLAADPVQLALRRDALRECARLEIETVRLRTAAAKEKQIVRQVELNLELKRTEAAHAAALAKL
jgi:hypothetical protein